MNSSWLENVSERVFALVQPLNNESWLSDEKSSAGILGLNVNCLQLRFFENNILDSFCALSWPPPIQQRRKKDQLAQLNSLTPEQKGSQSDRNDC